MSDRLNFAVAPRDPSAAARVGEFGDAFPGAEIGSQSPGANPRCASFGSERWLAQARVEGTYRFGSGATLIPLADFSHARDVMEAFPGRRSR